MLGDFCNGTPSPTAARTRKTNLPEDLEAFLRNAMKEVEPTQEMASQPEPDRLPNLVNNQANFRRDPTKFFAADLSQEAFEAAAKQRERQKFLDRRGGQEEISLPKKPASEIYPWA